MTYIGTTINESATIVMKAKADIPNPQGLGLAISDGKLALPAASGAVAMGIALFTMDDLKAGDDVTIQIKDIGKVIAGEAIAAGDPVTFGTDGRAVKAETAGDFIFGYALSAATAAGNRVTIQITKSGFVTA
ncbi:MAG: DUF2190 family protein [Clostridium sp.]|nr:DUF2190 family protein [Clostridium sp.]